MNELYFHKGTHLLVWGVDRYRAVSGPFGRGALHDGRYTVEVRNVVTGPSLTAGFRDKLTGQAWVIPIKPQFATSRHGLAIHPDGNVPGTLGCIGIQGADAGKFWFRWTHTPMAHRPVLLIVHSL